MKTRGGRIIVRYYKSVLRRGNRLFGNCSTVRACMRRRLLTVDASAKYNARDGGRRSLDSSRRRRPRHQCCLCVPMRARACVCMCVYVCECECMEWFGQRVYSAIVVWRVSGGYGAHTLIDVRDIYRRRARGVGPISRDHSQVFWLGARSTKRSVASIPGVPRTRARSTE